MYQSTRQLSCQGNTSEISFLDCHDVCYIDYLNLDHLLLVSDRHCCRDPSPRTLIKKELLSGAWLPLKDPAKALWINKLNLPEIDPRKRTKTSTRCAFYITTFHLTRDSDLLFMAFEVHPNPTNWSEHGREKPLELISTFVLVRPIPCCWQGKKYFT